MASVEPVCEPFSTAGVEAVNEPVVCVGMFGSQYRVVHAERGARELPGAEPLVFRLEQREVVRQDGRLRERIQHGSQFVIRHGVVAKQRDTDPSTFGCS